MDAATLDILRDGALILDGDNRIVEVNSLACEMLGCARDDLRGEAFACELGDNDVAEAVLADGRGLKILVEMQARVLPDTPEHRVIFLRDISREKDMKHRLHMLYSAVESSANGMILVDADDPEMPIVFANSAFETITGYSEHEVLGRNCRFLQREDRNQPELEKLRSAIASGLPCEVELRNYRKNGEMFWNALSLSPVRDDDGEVSHYLGIQTDVTDRKRLEEERRYRESHDGLTGLPNLGLIRQVIADAIDDANNSDMSLAVMFIDVDHFKPINDTMGHRCGDQVLVEMAKRLKAITDDRNRVARISGDEFIVVADQLPGESGVLNAVEQAISVFEQPFLIDDESLYITGSLGISVLNGNNRDPEQLIQEADIAMYRAKQLGRNTYHFFAKGLDSNYRQHVKLKSELQSALRNGEFFLEYQPKADLLSGQLTGFEALVRWRHPELGLLPPGEFIPTAEETGLIVNIGKWVMARACEFNRDLLEAGLADVPVAVNVSTLQFIRPDFVDDVRAVLDATRLPPDHLELELTESIMMESSREGIDKIKALKELGVHVSVDDFGTGYSSLNYLKRLPVDTLKIDASFVREITESRSDAGIVLAIISLAHNLGISVVAEGIETHAQLLYLSRNQCDEGQGFLISHPLPEQEMKSYLASNIKSWMPFLEDLDDDEKTLLLVDDEPNILRALTRLLRRDGYNIIQAHDAREALEKLAMHQVQVIISDQRMPGMSGIELLSKVKDMYPDTIRMVLSGYTELETVTSAINRGAIYRFLTKPWDDDELRKNVREAFNHQESRSQEGRGLTTGGMEYLSLVSGDTINR